MAKAIADVDGDNTGGFASDNSNVTGTVGHAFTCSLERADPRSRILTHARQVWCGLSVDKLGLLTSRSGTGGNPSLGHFPLFPQAFCPGDELDNCRFPKTSRAIPYLNDSIKTSPGYFGITLQSQISAEMTVTNHTALYHFDFQTSVPDGSPISPLMILDLTDLNDSRQNATVSIDPANGRMKGNGTFLPSLWQWLLCAPLLRRFSRCQHTRHRHLHQ